MVTNKPKLLASVDRALSVIEYLADAGTKGSALHSLAEALQINKATAHNTLATLRERGWVEQDVVSGYYRLGEGVRPIASYFNEAWSVADIIHPALVAISNSFNELVHLGRLRGNRVVYVDKVEPDRSIRVVSRIGKEVTAVSTALGRAIIGEYPDRNDRIDWLFSDPILNEADPETLVSLRKSLLDNFDLLDQHGWTQEIGENENGIACVAVPIRAQEDVKLAVSVSTPIERMPEERRPLIARGIATEISKLPPSVGITVDTRLLQAPQN